MNDVLGFANVAAGDLQCPLLQTVVILFDQLVPARGRRPRQRLRIGDWVHLLT